MENREAKTILQAHVIFACEKAGLSKAALKAVEDALDMAISALEQQEKAIGEWCTDCKEYDHSRHCCPRFNRVIRGALAEMEGKNEHGKEIHYRT